jgi:hypothetical protein
LPHEEQHQRGLLDSGDSLFKTESLWTVEARRA